MCFIWLGIGHISAKDINVEQICQSYKMNLQPNSWAYNFIEGSGHNLASSQTWGFVNNVYITNHFCSREGGGVE